uniref:Uncharacterized protein LOC114331788 isoform X2 n=1 Tax=Diabrotica virgifera virgifera TaxID=50390 RepID=A0A6P7FWE9_DIAVI
MQRKSSIPHKKILCFTVFITSCLILTVFYYDNTILNYAAPFATEEIAFVEEPEYLVSSPKCKIPNYHPFNKDTKRFYHKQKYKPCTYKKILTYVTVKDNIATLHVDTESVPSYTSNGVTCCYSNITRVNYSKDPDKRVKWSTCTNFVSNVTIFRDPVYVKCLDKKTRKELYENAHAITVMDETIQKKLESFDNTTNPFSILLIGIDSISRLNFIRSLPNTHKFVEQNGWIPLKGYNKMADNTFPNLMAILTGFNNSRAYQVCNPRKLGKLDECPMIWYDFKKLGFITGYAEDSASINTFNYRKVGFTKPPTDYYYRPYILGTENLHKFTKNTGVYCTGPETSGERIMNVAKDFAITFKNYPSFGFFWMNSFSHSDLNSPSGMDDKVKHLLQDITNEGITNNSIVIFLSDHGMRLGGIRLTDTGWLEERLPFIYVSFPSWFKKGFPKEYENFKINSNRLTCPYDLHMTLKHILVLSGRDYKITPGESCPQCKSLFEEVDADRSCADAAIEKHWCTCIGHKKKNFSKKIKTKLATFTLNVIHDIIRSGNSDHKCAKYSLFKVLDVKISENFSAKNESYVLLQFQTNPKAVFETTVSYIGDINTSNLSLSGDISRLDSYDKHSKCVSDAYLRKYCYCGSNGEKV